MNNQVSCTIKVSAGELMDVLAFHKQKLNEERERFTQACNQYVIDNPKEKRHWFFWKKRLTPVEVLDDGCDFLYGIFDGHADKLIKYGCIQKKDYITLSRFWCSYGQQISLWSDEVSEVRQILSVLNDDEHDVMVTITSTVAQFVGRMKKAMYLTGEY